MSRWWLPQARAGSGGQLGVGRIGDGGACRRRADPGRAHDRADPNQHGVDDGRIGVALLVAILVFILQNGQRVRVRFLMMDGTLQLGVALLFAALLGAMLVLVAGAARVLQLRVVAPRHRRTDQRP